jgi:hypothetical protein
MTGSSIDFIVIPIVAVTSLAAWLIMVYWADSHPQRGGEEARADRAKNQRAGTQPKRPTVPPADRHQGLRS